MKTLNEWVTTSVAAEYLGVSRQRVHQLIQAGLITDVRIVGKTYIINKDEMRAFKKIKRRPGRPKKEVAR